MNTSRKLEATRLTKAKIVAAAISLLNDEGLDGVSLRKLAGRLGVRAPSLYWHFPDKDALLAAVLEKIFNSCLDSVPDSRHWQTWMRSFGRALWRKQGIRDFGRLITTTDIDATQLDRTRERIRSKVANLDIPEAEAMRLQSSVQALVAGWSAFAHAPYSPTLSRLFSFRKMAMDDLELLIAGAQQARNIASPAPQSRRNAGAPRGRTSRPR